MSRRNDVSEDEDDVEFIDSPEDQWRFSAEQDPHELRQTRLNLLQIINDTKRNRANLITGDIAALEKHLDDVNVIKKKVRARPEMVLDAHICSNIADLGKERTKSIMAGTNNFQTSEFARNVRTAMLTDCCSSYDIDGTPVLTRETWVLFGQQCQKYLKRSPSLHFMFGSFSRGPPIIKLPKERVYERTKEKDNILTVPRKISSLSDPQKTEMTCVEVDKIYRILKVYRTPVCYFQFIINPESFDQSVENMFYTSFLIKDGYAKLSLDFDMLPIIEKIERPVTDGDTSGTLQSLIVTLTKKDWRNIVKTYKIDKCIIPTRKVTETSRLKRT